MKIRKLLNGKGGMGIKIVGKSMDFMKVGFSFEEIVVFFLGHLVQAANKVDEQTSPSWEVLAWRGCVVKVLYIGSEQSEQDS